MARRYRENIPSVSTTRITVEGDNNTTTANITFNNDQLSFNDSDGNTIFSVDSSGEANFTSGIRLPDGTFLNTVNDVNVQDFELRVSSPVVIYSNESTPKEPGTFIVVQAVLTNLNTETATFTLSQDVEYVVDQENSNIIRIPVESFNNINLTTLEITATADRFSESIIITKLLEGGDGISVVVTNPSDVLSADENGNIFQSDIENSNGQFILYKGAINLTEQGLVSYEVDDQINVNISFSNPTSGIYQLSAFTGLSTETRGGATLKARYDGVTYPFNYSVTKAIKGQKGDPGQDGQNGKDGESGVSPYLGIVSDENIFIDTVNNDDVANIAENSVGTSFTKEINGVTKTFYPLVATVGQFQILIGTEFVPTNEIVFDLNENNIVLQEKNGLYFEIESDGSYRAFIEDRRVQQDNGWDENSEVETFTVRARIDGITVSTKKIKIQKTKIGKDGKTGPSLKLSVTPQYFRFDGEGQPLEDNETLSVKIIPLNVDEYYGAGNYSVILDSDPNIIFNGTGNERTLPVSNFIDSNGDYLNYSVVTAKILVAGQTVLEDPVTIARTQSGTNAKSIVLSSDSFVFPFRGESAQSDLEFVTITVKTQNLKTPLVVGDVTITKSDSSQVSIPSEAFVDNNDGTYEFKVYLNSSDTTKISLDVSDKNTRDACFPVRIRVEDEDAFDLVSIAKLNTRDGLSGILTNEVDEIPAFADGNTDVADYATLNGTFQVYEGNTQLDPSLVIFSVVAQSDPDMEVTIDSNGFYQVTADSIKQGADVARRILQADYGNATIQKIFTVVKSKQGKNSLSVVLSNETHTIRAANDGSLILLSDLNAAGGNIKVFDGNENVTDSEDVKFYLLQGSEDALVSDSIDASGRRYHEQNGLRFTIANTGLYILTTANKTSWLETDAEAFYIKIVYKEGTDDEVIITRTYTITKSKGGADAKILRLSSNRQIFSFNSDNELVPTNQTIIFTANLQNITIDDLNVLEWGAGAYTSMLEDVPGEPYKKRISGTNFRNANIDELSVTATVGNFSDTITIVKTKDGAAGDSSKLVKLSTTSNVILYATRESLVPEPNSITIFVDGQNLESEITLNSITIKDKDDQTVTLSGAGRLQQDSVDTNDKYFSINIQNGESDTSYDVTKSQFPLSISVSIDGVRDTLTINALEGGSNGINLLMSNESHIVPADPNGNVDENGLADAGGLLEFYEGITKKVNTAGQTDVVKFTIKPPDILPAGTFFNDYSPAVLQTSLTSSSGLIMTIDQETGAYTLSETPEGWSSDSATFELAATYSEQTFTKVYSIVKSREGVEGKPGKDGKTVILESTQYFIPYKEDNTTSTLSFELTATGYNLDTNKVITYEFLKGTTLVVDNANFDINNNKLIIRDLPTPGETDTYFVNVFEDAIQVAQDSVSIIATKEGSDAITVSIPNDNHTFTAEADGTVLDNSDSGTKIQVLVGNTILNALESSDTLVPGSFKISAQGSTGITEGNLTRTDSEGSPIVYKSITMDEVDIAQNTNNGTITFTISLIKPNSTTETVITRIASYSKSVKGADGTDAKALFLIADSESFYINKEGNVVNDTITFSVLKENIAADVAYTSEPADLLERALLGHQNDAQVISQYSEGFENAPDDGGTPTAVSFGDWINGATSHTGDGNTIETARGWCGESIGANSSDTGPSSPYEGNRYIYTEASGQTNKYFSIQRNFTAEQSSEINFLSFFYHMYGLDTGYLSVSASLDGTTWVGLEITKDIDGTPSVVESIQGQQQTSATEQWKRAEVNLQSYSGKNFSIRFLAKTGNNFRSDISIDDIEFLYKTPIYGDPVIPATLTYENFSNNTNVKVTATAVEDGKTYTSDVIIRKVESGTDGAQGPKGTDSKTVKLESNDYQIAYDAAGSNPNGSATNTITLTATQQNHEGTVYYEFLLDGTSITNANTTSNTYTYTLPTTKALFGNPKTFTVNTREGSSTGTVKASDSISIVATKDGDNAFTITIPNDNHTFVADQEGNIESYTGGGTDIKAYWGNNELATSTATNIPYNSFKVTVNEQTNITAGSVSSDLTNELFVLEPSAMTADSASIVLSIEVRGPTGPSQTFYRTLSYSKSKKGEDGIDDRIYIFDKLTTVNGVKRFFGWRHKLNTASQYQTDQDPIGALIPDPATTDTIEVKGEEPQYGGNTFRLTLTKAESDSRHVYSDFIPVSTNKTYETIFRAKRSSTASRLRIYLIFYGANKNYISNTNFQLFPEDSGVINEYSEYKNYITGESSSQTMSVFETDTKYIRLLIETYHNETAQQIFDIDACIFREATANLDGNGRTPEENSLNNKLKVSSTYPYEPPEPQFGDKWIIPATTSSEELIYSYVEKTISAQDSATVLATSNNGPEGNFWDTNPSFYSKFRANGSSEGALYFIRQSSSRWYSATLSFFSTTLFVLRSLTNDNLIRTFSLKDYVYGTITVEIQYTPLWWDTNNNTYFFGSNALDKWNSSIGSVQPEIKIQYKNPATATSWVDAWVATKSNTNEDGYVGVSQGRFNFLKKQITITPTTNTKSLDLRFSLNNKFHASNIWWNNFPGWGIHLIKIVGFQRDQDNEQRIKIYELALDQSYSFKTFTGQHLCVFQDENLEKIEPGKIVSSIGTYSNMNYENDKLENKVTSQEAVPVVKITDKEKDKSAIGVVNSLWDMYKYNDAVLKSDGFAEEGTYKRRYEINSLGEGGIWVTNYNGNLENGDYITSSPIPGYGMKQDDDILRNYTVAKITCDCDFNLESEIYDCEEFEWEGQTYRRAFVGCTYHCG